MTDLAPDPMCPDCDHAASHIEATKLRIQVRDLRQDNKGLLEVIDDWRESYETLEGMYKEVKDQLDDIKQRGYGSLYADKLVESGHHPWMHGPNAEGCWCR